jgi:hypothetical protein
MAKDEARIKELAEEILKIISSERVLNKQTMNWRDQPATEKQLALMDKKGIYYKPDITKGGASDLINEFYKRGRKR